MILFWQCKHTAISVKDETMSLLKIYKRRKTFLPNQNFKFLKNALQKKSIQKKSIQKKMLVNIFFVLFLYFFWNLFS